MEEILSAVEPWARGKNAPPSVIQFQMIDGCNQKCRFCDFPANEHIKNKLLLEDEEYYKIIREAIDFGVKEIRLCGGGEPFFRKSRAMKIISMIKNTPIKCRIITNGSMLHKKDIQTIVDFGVEDIQFSVHGPDSLSHDYLVDLKGAFSIATSNINYLNEYKKKVGKNLPFVSIYFILTKKNYKKLDKMAKLVVKLGVNRLGIYDVDLRSEESKSLKLNYTERESIKEELNEIKEFLEKMHVDFYYQETILHVKKNKGNNIINLLNIDMHKKDLLNVPCYEPWYYLGIGGDGQVEICPEIGVNGLSIKGKSIKKFWYGKEMDKIRQKLLKKEMVGNCQFCCNLEITIPVKEHLTKNG